MWRHDLGCFLIYTIFRYLNLLDFFIYIYIWNMCWDIHMIYAHTHFFQYPTIYAYKYIYIDLIHIMNIIDTYPRSHFKIIRTYIYIICAWLCVYIYSGDRKNDTSSQLVFAPTEVVILVDHEVCRRFTWPLKNPWLATDQSPVVVNTFKGTITYPHQMGKGKPSSKVPWDGIWLFPGG